MFIPPTGSREPPQFIEPTAKRQRLSKSVEDANEEADRSIYVFHSWYSRKYYPGNLKSNSVVFLKENSRNVDPVIDFHIGNPFWKYSIPFHHQISFDLDQKQWRCPTINFINSRGNYNDREFQYFDTLDEVKLFLCQELNLEPLTQILTPEVTSLALRHDDDVILPLLFEDEPIGSYLISYYGKWYGKVFVKVDQNRLIHLDLPKVSNVNNRSYIPDPLDLCSLSPARPIEYAPEWSQKKQEIKARVESIKETYGFTHILTTLDFSRLKNFPKDQRERYIEIFPEETKKNIANLMFGCGFDMHLLNLFLKFSLSCPNLRNFIFNRPGISERVTKSDDLISFKWNLEILKETFGEIKYNKLLSQLLPPLLNSIYGVGRDGLFTKKDKYEETYPHFLNETRSDLSLIVESKAIPVHGIILAMRAPGFKCVMDSKWGESAKKEMELPSTVPFYSYALVKKAIEFIYTGSIENLKVTEAISITHMASLWQSEELKRFCECSILDSFKKDNPCFHDALSNLHQIISNPDNWNIFSRVIQESLLVAIGNVLPTIVEACTEEIQKSEILEQLLHNWLHPMEEEVLAVEKKQQDQLTIQDKLV